MFRRVVRLAGFAFSVQFEATKIMTLHANEAIKLPLNRLSVYSTCRLYMSTTLCVSSVVTATVVYLPSFDRIPHACDVSLGDRIPLSQCSSCFMSDHLSSVSSTPAHCTDVVPAAMFLSVRCSELSMICFGAPLFLRACVHTINDGVFLTGLL